MSWHTFGTLAAWMAGGFVFASLVEYWGHRLMHTIRWGPGKKHREHHAAGGADKACCWSSTITLWAVFG